jgi:hypothetical protein
VVANPHLKNLRHDCKDFQKAVVEEEKL